MDIPTKVQRRLSDTGDAKAQDSWEPAHFSRVFSYVAIPLTGVQICPNKLGERLPVPEAWADC